MSFDEECALLARATVILDTAWRTPLTTKVDAEHAAWHAALAAAMVALAVELRVTREAADTTRLEDAPRQRKGRSWVRVKP